MLIGLKAVNAENDDGQFGIAGKDFNINADEYDILGREGYITIQAHDYVTTGTGSRGGTPRTTNYHAAIVFYPKDLQRILDEAITKKLVKIPGVKELEAAQKLVEEALARMR